MPAPGDQHHAWKNPYEEEKPRISQWTAQEIATIANKLDKQLGPEYISARAGPGGQKVHYLTAEKCITLANEIFGFNGWSSSIQNIQVDFADENPQTQRVSIGLSVIVRVTLRDGTYHEDIGYGSIENSKGKAMAFEKAKKEGTTDGLKRALRSFGNVLGNCIYDQNYVRQVVKHKAQPVKTFDPNNLHRHADFVPKEQIKQEPMAAPKAAPPAAAPAPVAAPQPPQMIPSESFEDFLGELDEADFCVPEDGHPDEVVLPANEPAKPGQVQPNNGTGTSSRRPQTPNQPVLRPQNGNAGNVSMQARPPAHAQATNQPPQGPPGPPPPAPAIGDTPETVGFFSAKAVNQLPESAISGENVAKPIGPQGAQAFNPRLESPSIRKTPGIDHNSSKPVGRNGQHVAPTNSQAAQADKPNGSSFTPVRPSMGAPPARSGNVVNPNLEQTRRIGAPSGPASPLGNRSTFRQPTMKRPSPGDGNPPRPALADLPSNAKNDSNATGTDVKRQRMA